MVSIKNTVFWNMTPCSIIDRGHAMTQLVEEMRYKPEGRGFDSPCCRSNFSLT